MPKKIIIKHDGEDVPISFGYKSCWLAIQATSSDSVATTLNLVEVHPCTWKDGYRHIYDLRTYTELRGLYVTPPVQGWVLAAGSLPQIDDSALTALLESISTTFNRVCYFGTHRFVEYQAWARAEKGSIQRRFGFLGERCEFSANAGPRTAEEVELGTGLEDLDNAPTEETVLDLAARWSIDPRELHKYSEAQGPGLFGKRPADT